MAEINKVQIVIRKFLYEIKDVVKEPAKAQEWLSSFAETLQYQDLCKNPNSYAVEILEDAKGYCKKQAENRKSGWEKKKKAQDEQAKFGKTEQPQKKSQTENEMPYYIEPNDNIGEPPEGFTATPIKQDIDTTDYSDERVKNMDVVEFTEPEPQHNAEFTFSAGHIGVSFSDVSNKNQSKKSYANKLPNSLNEVLNFCYESKMYDDEWVKWWYNENEKNGWMLPDGKKINNWKALLKKAFKTKDRR